MILNDEKEISVNYDITPFRPQTIQTELLVCRDVSQVQ